MSDESVDRQEELKSRALELIERDLELWRSNNGDGKEAQREMLLCRKQESLERAKPWLVANEDRLLRYFADGAEIDPNAITPEIEFCETQLQHDLFRYARLHWSMPYSDYVGRRYRILVRDSSLVQRPIIGIAALGSALWALKPRDDEIGWNRETREDRLPFVMDVFVLGAMPPYNHILGGKLVALLVSSNQVREYHRSRYANRPTVIRKRVVNDLVLLVTTSLFGKNTSLYNRLRYNGELLYHYCGETSGQGTIHFTDETVEAIREFLSSTGISISHRFGKGPNWRIRLIRTGLEQLKLDAKQLLKHGQTRGVFLIPMASNAFEFLRGETDDIEYCDRPVDRLIDYWKRRWLRKRIQRPEIMRAFRSHTHESLRILQE